MTIQELKDLMASGEFDHAIYCCFGSVWEGLWIYCKAADGFRGYAVAGVFPKGHPDLPEAERLVAGTGHSVGAYGQG